MSISASHASPLAPVVRRLAEKIRIPEARFGLEPLSLRLRSQWDAYVRCHSQGSFFHTTTWLESVVEVFQHDPHHLLARCDGRIVGVLPLSQVRSRLGGTMLVSVPYAVAGGVLSDNDAVAEGLKALALKIAHQSGANVIELRSEVRQFDDFENIERYITFKRELPERAEDVLGWLPRKVRAAARSARNKHGLRAEFGAHHLRAVWRLYCRSMRRLGSICYPLRFFEALTERAGANAFVQVICDGPRVVGGLLSFRFGNTFLPYFVGYDERCKQMSVSNFTYLTAMERAVESRCRVFDFGRSRIDNQGSYDFKRFHGFKPQPLGYQRLRLGGEHAPELTPSDPRFRLARAVWPHLPLPVSIRMGTWASHHIPG